MKKSPKGSSSSVSPQVQSLMEKGISQRKAFAMEGVNGAETLTKKTKK